MDKYPKYISQEQQELFESYLREEMSLDENKSFESRLAKDQNLNASFKEFKTLFEIIEEESLKSKIKDFHKAIDKKTLTVIAPKTKKLKFNYRIAASVAFLIAMGTLWFLNQPNANEKLFNKYYTQDPGLPTLMGSNENYAFYEAMVDYKRGDYNIAISKWKKLLETKPENDTLNYFLGSAHLANKEFEKALDYLLKNKNNKSSHFYEETNFYIGMVYVKRGEFEKARNYLKKCTSPKCAELLVSIQKQ